MPIGSLIGAGASLIGGFLNSSATRKNNEAQLAHAQQQMAMQKEFAQQGIRWKVDDAKAAGIHPLYALGANTTSYSPVTVGSQADTSIGSAVASAGQDLSRAVNATRTQPERLAAIRQTELALDGMQLDNDIKRASLASSIQRLTQTQNPPIPSTGPFPVPEADKAEERQPLMLEGKRVLTSPNTSPAKAWEDQLGDDLFSPGFLPNLWGMIKENTKDMSFIDVLRAIDKATAIPLPKLKGRR